VSEVDSGEESQQGSPDVDEHRVDVLDQTEVREIFQAIIKHGRVTRLYGATHQHTESFLRSFVEGIVRFLKRHEMLMVEIEPDQLLFQGKQVLSADSSGERFIYGLYSEGARAIGVEKNASLQEIQGLAELLSRDWTSRGTFDDDLIAAAWRLELRTIHIDVADRFSEEDELGDAVVREDIMIGQAGGGRDSLHTRGDSVLIPEIQGLLAELEAGADVGSNVVRLKQDEAALFIALQDDLKNSMGMSGESESSNVLPLESAAQRTLEKELAQLEAGKDVPLELMGALVFECLRLEKREAVVFSLGKHIARHCSTLCAGGMVVGAAEFMRRLLLICDREVFPDFDYEVALRRGFSSFVHEANRRRLLDALPTNCVSSEERAALFTLLSMLGRHQLPELIRFGSDLKVAHLRQVVADVVVQLVGSDEEALMTLLVTGEEEEAVIPLLALGRINAPSCVEECLRRMGDPNPMVREASLRAVRGQQSPRIRQEVLRCIKDDESSIRIEALRYLSVYRDRVDLALLEQVLLSPRLATFEMPEVKAWVVAYGIIGRIGALKLLRSVLEGKVKLALPLKHLQTPCLQAILSINSVQAQALLELLGRKDPDLKLQISKMKAKRGMV
jgi:hypothetical protein